MPDRHFPEKVHLPIAALPEAEPPLPLRPGEIDEDETANEPPDVKPDHRHWPQPDDEDRERPGRDSPQDDDGAGQGQPDPPGAA